MVGERLRGGGGARAARTKMKAGLGFEATIAPNTTSGLADEGTQGRHQDWARGRGDIFTEGFEALLEVLIGVSIYFGFSRSQRRLLDVVVGVSISASKVLLTTRSRYQPTRHLPGA